MKVILRIVSSLYVCMYVCMWVYMYVYIVCVHLLYTLWFIEKLLEKSKSVMYRVQPIADMISRSKFGFFDRKFVCDKIKNKPHCKLKASLLRSKSKIWHQMSEEVE